MKNLNTLDRPCITEIGNRFGIGSMQFIGYRSKAIGNGLNSWYGDNSSSFGGNSSSFDTVPNDPLFKIESLDLNEILHPLVWF